VAIAQLDVLAGAVPEEKSSKRSPLLPILVGAAVLIVVIGAAVYLVRRRRSRS